MKKQLFWGLLSACSFLLLFISSIVLYFSPSDAVAVQSGWVFMNLPKQVWKLDFIFLFLLFIASTTVFFARMKKAGLYSLIGIEKGVNLLQQKELWVAVGVIFAGFILFALEIPGIVKLARVDSPVQNMVSEQYSSIPDEQPVPKKQKNRSSTKGNQRISIGDMDLTLVAENFVGLSAKRVIEKLNAKGINVKNINETLYEISDNNGKMPINEIYGIISEGEEVNREVRNGKPVGERSLAEAGREIGVDFNRMKQIFAANNIQISGSPEQLIKEISQTNNISTLDIYGVLSGRELTGAPANLIGGQGQAPDQSGRQSMALQAKDMTVNEFISRLKKSQPGITIDKETVLGRLVMAGVKIENEDATLSQIASANGMNTGQLLDIISGKNPVSQSGAITPKKLDASQSPQGQSAKAKRRQEIIQSTLEDLAIKNGKKPADLVQVLKSKGISAQSKQTIQQIAQANNKKPGEILKILRANRN